MRVVLRPPGDDPEYQDGLDTCFSDWGGARASRWYFRAVGDGPPADRLVVEDGGRAIAGMAVTHRTLRLAVGSELRVGMLTGAWTRPSERGRGCLARLVEAAERHAAERGVALLMGFGVQANASHCVLVRAGHSVHPTRYWIARAPGGAAPTPARDPCASPADPPELLLRPPPGTTHVAYPSPEAWRSQFLERPRPTALVPLRCGGWAALEHTPDTDRVQALACARGPHGACLAELRDRAHARGRHLFWFDMGGRGAPGPLDAALRPGAMTVAVTAPEAVREALGAPPGSRVAPADLLDPASASSLGPWWIHNGDRM